MKVVIDGVEYVPFVHKEDGKWLDLRFYDNISLNRDVTIREFLAIMLDKLWVETDCFSGKRPFGNSCWDFPVMAALGKAGAFPATVTKSEYEDEPDDVRYDVKVASQFVRGLIAQMCLGGE